MKYFILLLMSFLPIGTTTSQNNNDCGYVPSKYEQFIYNSENLITTIRTRMKGINSLYMEFDKSTNHKTNESKSAVIIHSRSVSETDFNIYPLGIVIDNEDLDSVISKLKVILTSMKYSNENSNENTIYYSQKLTPYLFFGMGKSPAYIGENRMVVLSRVSAGNGLGDYSYVYFSIKSLEKFISALE